MKYTVKKRKANSWSGIVAFAGTALAFTPSLSAKTKRLNINFAKEGKGSQEYFEEGLHLEKGALTTQVNMSTGQLISEYWRNFNMEIGEKGVELDTNLIEDELKVLLLKSSGLVAKRGELSSSAVLELFNEEEYAEKTSQVFNYKAKAYKLFAELSASEKLDYCISKGYKADNVSGFVIDDLIGRDIENDPAAFVSWLDNDLYKAKVKLNKYVAAKIITKTGNIYTYRDTQLGATPEFAINFLRKPSNQKIIEGIQQEYEYYLDSVNNVELPIDDASNELKESLEKGTKEDDDAGNDDENSNKKDDNLVQA